MKKRILFFLLALVLVFSLPLSSCSEATSTSEDGEEEKEIELSAKEVFFTSLADPIVSFSSNRDFVEKLSFEIDHCRVDGVDALTELQGYNRIDLSFPVDVDGKAAMLEAVISGGGNPEFSLSGVFTEEAFYLTKLLGELSPAVAFPLEEILSLAEGEAVSPSLSNEDLAAIELLEKIDLSAFPETAFQAQNADRTVLEKQFKNAYVVTLTVDDETVESYLKGQLGEDYESLTGGEALPDFTVSAVNTVVNGKSVALEIQLSSEEEDESVRFAYANDSQGTIAELNVPNEMTVRFVSETDSEGNYHAELTLRDLIEDTSLTPLRIDGVTTPTSFDGKIIIDTPDLYTSMMVSAKQEGKTYSLTLKDPTVRVDAESRTIALECALKFTEEEGKVLAEMSLTVDEEELSLSLKGTFSMEEKDVAVSIPEETIPFTEWNSPLFGLGLSAGNLDSSFTAAA